MPSLWMSEKLENSASLFLAWDGAVELNEVDIAFDTNLDRLDLDRIAPECVKSFVLKADGKVIFRCDDNSQRFVRCMLPEAVKCSKLTLEILATHGADNARVVYLRCF